MPKERSAVYAGTFDILTNGHLHILNKAAILFDKIFLVVADNSEKKTMFTLEERMDMAQAAVASLPKETSVSIVKLTPFEYLVNFAYKAGACCMIRGIRDNIDFAYEEKLHRTNLAICPKVETIYIMPDDTHSLISSSWVKGLIGQNGWREIVAPTVPKNVFEALKKLFFKKLVDKFVKNMADVKVGFSLVEPLKFTGKIIAAYNREGYHNYDHLLDGLEIFNNYLSDGNFSFTDEDVLTITYAWLMHDYDKSEQVSMMKAADFCLAQSVNKQPILDLIDATKHRENKNFEPYSAQALFASVDLMVLAWPWSKYHSYVAKIEQEYVHLGPDTVNKGRMEFLEEMLAKKVIFPYPPIEAEYGLLARNNMELELHNREEKGRAEEGVY